MNILWPVIIPDVVYSQGRSSVIGSSSSATLIDHSRKCIESASVLNTCSVRNLPNFSVVGGSGNSRVCGVCFQTLRAHQPAPMVRAHAANVEERFKLKAGRPGRAAAFCDQGRVCSIDSLTR
jgi:hypothetical protein